MPGHGGRTRKRESCLHPAFPWVTTAGVAPSLEGRDHILLHLCDAECCISQEPGLRTCTEAHAPHPWSPLPTEGSGRPRFPREGQCLPRFRSSPHLPQCPDPEAPSWVVCCMTWVPQMASSQEGPQLYLRLRGGSQVWAQGDPRGVDSVLPGDRGQQSDTGNPASGASASPPQVRGSPWRAGPQPGHSVAPRGAINVIDQRPR